jgi:hypothetical protein
MRVLWPLGVALRGETPNHLELRWLKTVVVSVEEKARARARQVGIRKASESDPLMTCRNKKTTSKPGGLNGPGMEPGGCPSIGQAVSGMEAARAWSAASARNVGRRVPILGMPAVRTGGPERECAEQQKL